MNVSAVTAIKSGSVRADETPEWDSGISLRAFVRHQFYRELHCHQHPQLEFVLMQEGAGHRCVSGRTEPFVDGDVMLIGEDVPHGYTLAASRARGHAVIVQFSRLPLASALAVPEMTALRPLLDRARGGLVLAGDCRKQVTAHLLTLISLPQDSWRRPLILMEILGVIAGEKAIHTMVRPPPDGSRRTARRERLNTVQEYLASTDYQDIRHRTAASRVGMSPSAFSRFFKRAMGHTFESYVNDARLKRACQALTDDSRTVVDVAFEAGFNSVGYFNRRFLQSVGMTPSAYRRSLLLKHHQSAIAPSAQR